MVPTQKTENMINDVQSALTLIQQSVNEPDAFDPASTKRNFKLSLGDVSEGRVLPFIMKEIYKDAPSISIGSFAYMRSDQVHALSTNNLDFVVDPIIPISKEINSVKVFEDDFVVMHREGHDISKINRVALYDLHGFYRFETRLFCNAIFPFVGIVFQVSCISNISNVAYFISQMLQVAVHQIERNEGSTIS